MIVSCQLKGCQAMFKVAPSLYKKGYGRYCSRKHFEVVKHQESFANQRNKEIVALCETGKLTLGEMGAIYGLTRERIRQIYQKTKGKSYRRRIEVNRSKKAGAKELWNKQERFKCAWCKKPVTNEDGLRLSKYCLKHSRFVTHGHGRRSFSVTLTCKECGNEFHPYRNRAYATNKQMKFCRRKCYIANIKRNIALFGHDIRYDLKKGSHLSV